MDDLAATRRGYDAVAERYLVEIGDELRHKPLDRGLLEALAEQCGAGILADVGCGPGHVGAYLAGRGARVVGFDLSPGMCAAARRTTSHPAFAADMTSLPVQTGSLAGIVCMYAVIHLDVDQRARAYAEFARTLRAGGHALIAFHVSSAQAPMGTAEALHEWWGEAVELTFRYLDPDAETAVLAAAGLGLVARLDREPYAEFEHASRRGYLLVRRPDPKV